MNSSKQRSCCWVSAISDHRLFSLSVRSTGAAPTRHSPAIKQRPAAPSSSDRATNSIIPAVPSVFFLSSIPSHVPPFLAHLRPSSPFWRPASKNFRRQPLIPATSYCGVFLYSTREDCYQRNSPPAASSLGFLCTGDHQGATTGCLLFPSGKHFFLLSFLSY